MPKRNPRRAQVAKDAAEQFRAKLNELWGAYRLDWDELGTAKRPSLTWLSEVSGVERTVLSRVMAGNRSATFEQMVAIASIHGFSTLMPTSILGGTGFTPQGPPKKAKRIVELTDLEFFELLSNAIERGLARALTTTSEKDHTVSGADVRRPLKSLVEKVDELRQSVDDLAERMPKS